MAGADPIQAARNLSEQERRAHEIRILVARGLITDLVAQLARLMTSREVTGPEEIRLQDLIMKEVLNYVRGAQSGPAVIEYLSPHAQARQVDEQSPAVAELRRMDSERKAAMERIASDMDAEVQKAIAEGNPQEVVAFNLPRTGKSA